MDQADVFWLKASFDISSDRLPDVEKILLSLGALSITIEDAQDQPLFEPLPGETPLWENSRLSALYPSSYHQKQLYEDLKTQLEKLDIGVIQIEQIENRQWERVWMDQFKPCRFGEKLWIVPTHCTAPDEHGINIQLDPGLAFGTGSHATTALCLEWLAENDLHNKSLMDYGCGSGILAIAAAKLGAEPIYAVDIDEQAILATTSNAKLNHVENRITSSLPHAAGTPSCDIVIANILSSILIKLNEPLGKLVNADGQLIMSGLLQDQVDDVINAYQDRFTFLEPRNQGDWVQLEGRRKPIY